MHTEQLNRRLGAGGGVDHCRAERHPSHPCNVEADQMSEKTAQGGCGGRAASRYARPS